VIQQAFAGQDLGGDSNTGGHHGRTHEDCLGLRLAPGQQDAPTQKERHDDAQNSDQHRRSTDPQQFGSFDLQTHAEKQEHHAEVRQCAQEIVRRHPAKHAGSDKNAGQDLAHDARLVEPLEELGQQLCGAEDHEHGQRDAWCSRRSRQPERECWNQE
jgi:hypothetical protein